MVAAAAAEFAPTQFVAKATISRTFGARKADDYVADDSFWSGRLDGKELRAGSREAALLILSAGGK